MIEVARAAGPLNMKTLEWLPVTRQSCGLPPTANILGWMGR